VVKTSIKYNNLSFGWTDICIFVYIIDGARSELWVKTDKRESPQEA